MNVLLYILTGALLIVWALVNLSSHADAYIYFSLVVSIMILLIRNIICKMALKINESKILTVS